MIDVVVDQRLFGFAYGVFNGVKLLSDLEARPGLLDHGNNAPKVSFSAFQALQDCKMGLMDVRVWHGAIPYLPSSNPIPLHRIKQRGGGLTQGGAMAQ